MDELVAQAAAVVAALPAAEREAALKDFRKLVVLRAPAEDLVVPPPVSTLADYLAVELPTPPRLVDPPLVVRSEITVTVGASGKGKTTMNIHRMLRWAAGLPMFPELPEILAPVDGTPLRILVIENEGAAVQFQQKMRRMLEPHPEYLTPEQAHMAADNFLLWGDGGYSSFKIDSPEYESLLRRGIEEHRPDIIFLEPFQSLHTADENDNTRIAQVLDIFQAIGAETHVGIVIAHHERKGGVGDGGNGMDLGRGASALNAAAAVWENFQVVRDEEFRELSYAKDRHGGGDEVGTLRMSWDKETGWYRLIPEADIQAELVAHLSHEPTTLDQLCTLIGEYGSKTGPGHHSVLRTLTRMKRAGLVMPMPKGTSVGWILSDDKTTGLGI